MHMNIHLDLEENGVVIVEDIIFFIAMLGALL